jgi:hypothetical protein
MSMGVSDSSGRNLLFAHSIEIGHVFVFTLRAGLHYGGEGLRLVKNAWPRHGYMRQMVDVSEKN